MTPTIAIILNAALAAGIVTALALVVRLAHRIAADPRPETVHPSQPLRLAVVLSQDEERELARAA